MILCFSDCMFKVTACLINCLNSAMKLRSLNKHQVCATCLGKVEVLMLDIKDSNMDQDWRNKDENSRRYYEPNTKLQ